ncbi:MAG: hypothetical protein B7X06_00310 [Verrucomicrobia bacterium 21-51-4]|nr:MAG: hypothetical protein B7X06_00310 [Verrucomicrobia bacterium 21-51-4]HQU08510.1 sugar transferase [Opitutales bacterium]
MKRIFDLLLILLTSPLWVPLLIGVAIAVRLKIGSPILFKQLRPGLKGKLFTMYKFRSMTDARDGHGRLLPESERLTSLGKFLRISSLDEIPQFINILKGDMSLVGPRPLGIAGMLLLKPEELCRHHVRPGITGWAQIHGRNQLDWSSKIGYDIWYAEHRSLGLDAKIIFKTIWLVLSQQGTDPSVTHPEVALLRNVPKPENIQELETVYSSEHRSA